MAEEGIKSFVFKTGIANPCLCEFVCFLFLLIFVFGDKHKKYVIVGVSRKEKELLIFIVPVTSSFIISISIFRV